MGEHALKREWGWSTALWTFVLGAAGLAALGAAWGGVRASLIGAAELKDVSIEGRGFPKTLHDPAGLAQALEAPPKRIVSATVASDEIFLEILDPDRLVSVTQYSENPIRSNIAGKYPKNIVRLPQAEIERILMLEPDMAIVAEFSYAETVRLMISSGIAVVRLRQAESFEAICRNIELLGAATGSEDRAVALVETLRRRIEAVKAAVAGRLRPKVLFYAYPDAGVTTRGVGTLIDEMIEFAGGRNVAREQNLQGIAKLTLEEALESEPEVLIFFDPNLMAQTVQDPVWQAVPAVRSGRVYLISEASLMTVSQYAADGMERIAHALHPEAFAP